MVSRWSLRRKRINRVNYAVPADDDIETDAKAIIKKIVAVEEM